MKYRVLIEQDEESMYVDQASPRPGCVSQGQTPDDTPHHINDAIVVCIESHEAHNNLFHRPYRRESSKTM